MTTPTCHDSARSPFFRAVFQYRIAALLLAFAFFATPTHSAVCGENDGIQSVPNIVYILADDK